MMTEDLAVFFDTDEHSTSVVFNGNSIDIVDAGVTSEFSETEYVVLVTWKLSVKTSDISSVVGQEVTVDGVKWEVSRLLDNSGVTDIDLIRRLS